MTMIACWNGAELARSDDTLVVEGNHYFPSSAIADEYFIQSDTTSNCPWKGTAHYRSVVVGGETNADAAWFYPDPKPEAAQIKGRFAFWKGVEVTEE